MPAAGDPLVANRPETQRLLTVMDAISFKKAVAPFLLAARLGDAQALQEGHRSSPPHCGPGVASSRSTGKWSRPSRCT